MDILALVLRPVIAALFFTIFVLFVATMGYGRAYAEERRHLLRVDLMLKYLGTHKRLARLVLRLTIAAVLLTEAYAWVNGRVLPHNWFFWLHLAASFMYLLGTWQLTHSWSGLAAPKIHKQVAYVTVTAFSVALLTGYARLFHEVTRQLGLGWLLQ